MKWKCRFRLKSDVFVYVPTTESLRYGRHLKSHLQLKWKTPDNYFHFLPGGHVSAVRIHQHSSYYLRADITKFFNSINRSRITRHLKKYYPYNIAREIALNSTVPMTADGKTEYVLPFGFAQSQILASICLHESKLGRFLVLIAKNFKLTVSVYVDDIIISGPDESVLQLVREKLITAANDSGLILNSEKLEGPAEQVTAFNIDLKNGSMSVSDKRMLAFKIALSTSQSENQKKAILGYVATVNPSQLKLLII